MISALVSLICRKTFMNHEECKMKIDIARAWKDEQYRKSLSADEQALLPANPAGSLELTDSDLAAIHGNGAAFGSFGGGFGDCGFGEGFGGGFGSFGGSYGGGFGSFGGSYGGGGSAIVICAQSAILGSCGIL
jgi:mersacidin/lichenicidin family type 2 lantibiotic